MIGQRKYYTLLASLPPIPHFLQCARLPINPTRLEDRLAMLHPEDARTAEQIADLLTWERQPPERTDAQVVEGYEAFRARSQNRLLTKVITFRVDRRTILAALRRKILGQPAPTPAETWGARPIRETIERNWNQPTFKLEPLYPWLVEASALIAAGRAVEMERLLLDGEWRWLNEQAVDDEFGFEAVLVYILRWNIVARWLSQDRPAARARFEKLVLEVTREHERLFV